MSEGKNKCMICAKELMSGESGICKSCQDRIRRDALGEQAGVSQQADKELRQHGITPEKK